MREEDIEMISCQLIAASGGAKSSYIEAIALAKEGKFDKAEEMMQEGKETYIQGHKAHFKLLEMSAQGKLEIPLLLIHAEDQMMNCETMQILANEMIHQCREIHNLKEKIN